LFYEIMTTSAKFNEFVAAQDPVYADVLRELSAGYKQTHWMWFIFPQLAGLGSSQLARKFSIASLEEARDYLDHAMLGPRLRECTRLVLASPGDKIESILGYPDDLKFRSSMTLFSAAAPEEALFRQALEKFFGGEPDSRTIGLLKSPPKADRER
jgi:uncharacterized protein (DUF1810 family)